MAHSSVLYKKQVEAGGGRPTPMPIEDCISKVKELASLQTDRKYKGAKKRKNNDQTMELVIHLGIDPKHADQMVRGALSLPKGLGKTRTVIAFCEGPVAEAAKNAGATEAGGEELIAKIQGGWMEFDVAIAHPSMMGKVGKLGRVLGPQGKMPTPKAGTVTPDVAKAVSEFSAGRLEYRNDAGGNIHLPVGKVSFSVADLKENIEAAIGHIVRAKPSAAKGQYVKRVCLSATRTPSVTVEVAA